MNSTGKTYPVIARSASEPSASLCRWRCRYLHRADADICMQISASLDASWDPRFSSRVPRPTTSVSVHGCLKLYRAGFGEAVPVSSRNSIYSVSIPLHTGETSVLSTYTPLNRVTVSQGSCIGFLLKFPGAKKHKLTNNESIGNGLGQLKQLKGIRVEFSNWELQILTSSYFKSPGSRWARCRNYCSVSTICKTI